MQAAKSIHKSRMSAHLPQRIVWSHLDKKPFLAVSWSPALNFLVKVKLPQVGGVRLLASRKQIHSTWQATLDASLSVLV